MALAFQKSRQEKLHKSNSGYALSVVGGSRLFVASPAQMTKSE